MPANEETLSVSSDQIRNNFLRKVCDNGLQSNPVRVSFDDDEEDCQNCCPESIINEDSEENCNYKSLPVREVHEKFMKSFVDLLLEEAVFEVSLLLKFIVRKIYIYIYILYIYNKYRNK